ALGRADARVRGVCTGRSRRSGCGVRRTGSSGRGASGPSLLHRSARLRFAPRGPAIHGSAAKTRDPGVMRADAPINRRLELVAGEGARSGSSDRRARREGIACTACRIRERESSKIGLFAVRAELPLPRGRGGDDEATLDEARELAPHGAGATSRFFDQLLMDEHALRLTKEQSQDLLLGAGEGRTRQAGCRSRASAHFGHLNAHFGHSARRRPGSNPTGILRADFWAPRVRTAALTDLARDAERPNETELSEKQTGPRVGRHDISRSVFTSLRI